ncbi:mechanosensitive ion channel family protein [Sulfitobacter sp. MF3-043]|uniref:mechanosensitive ion channel family protein n=1 Tax=Sulfitobacter sediminivivens TaxID=3252902 RepID=UPI0036DCCA75
MRALIICFFALLMSLAHLPTSVAAQSMGAIFPGGSTTETANTPAQNIEEIMRQAKESGVGVVVIDSAGNLLSQAPLVEDAAVVESEPEHSALMKMQDSAIKFRGALVERLLQLPDAFREVLYILRAASPDGTLWAFGKALFYSLLMFAAGILVEREIYGKRLVKPFVTARIMDDPQGYSEKMPFLIYRFVMGVVGILVSMAVAYVLGFAIFGSLNDTAMQFTVTLINIGYFACRFVAGLWRMILSPYLPQYRIPALNDHDAKRLHRWLWALASLDICAILFGLWIAELGLNYDVYAFLASFMSAFVVLMNILLVFVNRKAIDIALRHGKPLNECSLVIRILCYIWAPTVVLYVLFAWFALTYDLVLANPSSIPLIAGAYGILISIIVVYGVINYVIERGFSRARAIRRLNAIRSEEQTQAAVVADADATASDQPGDTEQDVAAGSEHARLVAAEEEARAAIAPRRTLNSFEALARRVAGILAFVAGINAFFYIWDSDGAEMVESYADRLLDIMVIIFIGYVIYHAFRIWIDTKIEEEVGEEEEVELGAEGGGSSATRLATLLPLFRNFTLILVVVTVLLIILMEVGVNVGPLFAGAGIVGIAIGFGSQALVRDVFAGAFFLFDDAFRKGEYLDVGGVKGTVEKISVRSFQLRHHLGYLHTIPFGELQVMTNYSRDWVIMKLPLRVTYDTDVERVRKLIKNLGIELLDDPVIGENFIQPLKSQGVIEMQDSAMIIRVKFMTKPGDQWLVRKRVFEEIRSLFERENIRFAHREVTVRLADAKVADLNADQKQAVAAAAQASMEQELADEDQDTGDDR